MNLSQLGIQENLYPGLQRLFQELKVPISGAIDDKPIKPQAILTDTFKEGKEAFELMEDVFFLGMIDDAAFKGTESESIEKIKEAQKDYDGILIFAVTLKNRPNGLLPTRTQLAQITRAFNREYNYTPVVVIYRYQDYITLANAERLPYKQEWREGEKAGKVTMLRDINIHSPHAGHLKILQGLNIQGKKIEIKENGSKTKAAITSFSLLYKYWQSVFDVSILNKQFYQELSDWYFWAMDQVRFPNNAENNNDTANATNLIRLLTRIIFTWFMKEKGLVPDTLFKESSLENLIKDFNEDASSNYYRAILQNLFFATFNQDMKERQFANDGGYHYHRVDYGVKSLYRYADHFQIKKEEVLELFQDIPFINGGLFDCLDKEDDDNRIVYIDGFTRKTSKQAVVPDHLFFCEEDTCDLNEVYNTSGRKYEVKGLFHIFNSYKFTVEENTPIEEDIALDPELLGQVFENLLASYNPETKTTARKQTGSYYTPREIVNYMVDESLKAHLKQKLEEDAGMPSEDAEIGLEFLVSYHEDESRYENLFNKEQTRALINAIDNCKIIDPACGSGAFPMGILHKMVHILHIVDPKNERWKERQLRKIQDIDDDDFRIKFTNNIEDAFENNELDFGRKLYLIENCIYGVDIQPIAIQICMLRFFISLLVDQKVQREKENLGIKPLPNLETKFVAANTLIGLEKPKTMRDYQNALWDTEKDDLKKELTEIRHQLFSARKTVEKRNLRKKDKEIRQRLAEILKKDLDKMAGQDQAFKLSLRDKIAHQLASWDPYDQNASSDFFDPEWMFGIKDGFDIVIGNPPYVDFRDIHKSIIEKLSHYKLKHKSLRPNLYMYFIENSYYLLKKRGVFVFINPNQFLSTDAGFGLRKLILDNTTIKSIIDLSYLDVFKEASTYTCIWIFIKESSDAYKIKVSRCSDLKNLRNVNFTVNKKNVVQDPSIIIPIHKHHLLLQKIGELHKPLSFFCKMIWGTSQSGYGKIKIKKNLYDSLDDDKKEKYEPLLQTKDIKRYHINWQREYIPKSIYSEKASNVFNQDIKILVARVTKQLQCSIDTEKRYVGKATVLYDINIDERYLLGILNSKLINYWYSTKYETVHMAGGYLRFDIPYIRNIPIPKYKQQNMAYLLKTVEAILNITKSDNYIIDSKKQDIVREYEREIDQIVYQLYDLTPEEIEIVEGGT